MVGYLFGDLQIGIFPGLACQPGQPGSGLLSSVIRAASGLQYAWPSVWQWALAQFQH